MPWHPDEKGRGVKPSVLAGRSRLVGLAIAALVLAIPISVFFASLHPPMP